MAQWGAMARAARAGPAIGHQRRFAAWDGGGARVEKGAGCTSVKQWIGRLERLGPVSSRRPRGSPRPPARAGLWEAKPRSAACDGSCGL
eukprot:6107657-Alexandrium_andersonii.AAC.1